jgi:hypothetical protein
MFDRVRQQLNRFLGAAEGREHPETLRALNGLGHVYLWRDEPDRAKPLFAQALQASRSRRD